MVALWAAVAMVGGQETPAAITPPLLARVTHPPIDEMSGIVRSDRYPGIYWVHNDSGDSARLFAIRRDGSVVAPAWQNRKSDAGVALPVPETFGGVQILGAQNVDWEDIARDGDTLYVADMGNNGNARRDLGVYEIPEPNPTAVDKTRPLRFIPVAYPDQLSFPPDGRWTFDCEAVFWLRGKLWVVSKDRVGASGMPAVSATLYRLDQMRPNEVNVLRRLGTWPNLGGWVTGADVSPDGSTLALLVQAPFQSVWFVNTRAKGDRLTEAPTRRLRLNGIDQAEAIAWEDNDRLLVTNEQRQIFEVRLGEAK